MKSILIDKFSALIVAAFGLVAALAWNSAIQAIFKQYFGSAETVGPLLTYAIVVTILAVLITVWIGKAEQKAKELELKIPFRKRKEEKEEKE